MYIPDYYMCIRRNTVWSKHYENIKIVEVNYIRNLRTAKRTTINQRYLHEMSAKVKNAYSYTSILPPVSSWQGVQLNTGINLPITKMELNYSKVFPVHFMKAYTGVEV